MGPSLSRLTEVRKRIGKRPIRSAQNAISEPIQLQAPVFNHSGFFKPYKDPAAQDDNYPFPLNNVEISSVSDEQLVQYYFTAPKLYQRGDVCVVRISKLLLIKGGSSVYPSESQNMLFARETLHLPVARVHRAFTAKITRDFETSPVDAYFVVMDYIPGPTVKECWDTLDLGQRQLVAGQVATLINTMQAAIINLPPGPVRRIEGQLFEGPLFTMDGAGPFLTLQALEDWYNHKIDVCIKFKQASRRTPRLKFQHMVLTHQDLSTRNLVLDHEGRVWIIDWGVAGMYPPGFEQAAFINQAGENRQFSSMVSSRLADQHKRLVEQFATIAYALSVAASH